MKRGLIVDDRQENLYFLRVLLKAYGFAVDEAMDGAQALVKARQQVPDIVITDLLMPVMDGYTLLRHWKADEQLKAVPFVVYTATYTDPKDRQLAEELGADAFIIKPAEPQAFIAHINQVLDKASRGEFTPASRGEQEQFKEYSEVLVRKLEEKAEQLEQANRALQADIVRRKRVEALLRDSEAQLRTLSRRLLDTEEAERRKLNRELHDRVGQNLSALKLGFNLIRADLPQPVQDAMGERLDETRNLLDDTNRIVRDVMANLHPPGLEEYGLWAALSAHVKAYCAQTGIDCAMDGSDPGVRLPPFAELSLFRIAQEALVNAAKHAKAGTVRVALVDHCDGGLSLSVADDGAGFEPRQVRGAGPSWGLTIMQERAQAAGASLTIDASPGGGTRVRVTFAREASRQATR